MNGPRSWRCLAAIVMMMIWPGGVPAAQAQGGDALRGRTITAQVAYETRARREGREFDNPVKFDFVINVGRDDKVTGTVTRHVIGPRGPQSETRPLSATLGKPTQGREGHRLALLSGNTLTLLNTFAVGGAKTTVTVSGSGCTIRSPLMKEAGAGPARRQAVVGGSIEILTSRQVSSSCRIQ